MLIFGVLTDDSNINTWLQYQKDEFGSVSLSAQSPVILALKYLSSKYPSLLLVVDVCLCAYTTHDHCGILDKHGYIDNKKSIERLSQLSLHYARAGANVIAPSDMMDGRTKAIKDILHCVHCVCLFVGVIFNLNIEKEIES